jgi:hypothetical protein
MKIFLINGLIVIAYEIGWMNIKANWNEYKWNEDKWNDDKWNDDKNCVKLMKWQWR